MFSIEKKFCLIDRHNSFTCFCCESALQDASLPCNSGGLVRLHALRKQGICVRNCFCILASCFDIFRNNQAHNSLRFSVVKCLSCASRGSHKLSSQICNLVTATKKDLWTPFFRHMEISGDWDRPSMYPGIYRSD